MESWRIYSFVHGLWCLKLCLWDSGGFILLLYTVPLYEHTAVHICYSWGCDHCPRRLQVVLLLALLPSYTLQGNFWVIEYAYLQLHGQIPIIQSSSANLHSHQQWEIIPLSPHWAMSGAARLFKASFIWWLEPHWDFSLIKRLDLLLYIYIYFGGFIFAILLAFLF